MKQVHVLHLVNKWEAGGVQRHIRDLVHGLHACGIDSTVAGYVTDPELDTDSIPLPLYRTGSERAHLAGIARSIRGLIEAVDSLSINLLHIHSRLMLPMAAAIAAVRGCARVETIHNMFDTMHWLPWHPVHCIALTDASRRQLYSTALDPARHTIHIVHNGVDASRSVTRNDAELAEETGSDRRPRHDSAHAPVAQGGILAEAMLTHPLRVCFVGRFVEWKGGDMLIRAIAAMARQQLPCTLHMYGDGPMRTAWEQLARDTGISAQVTFHGHMRDVRRAIAESDCVVLPSTGFEASPYVALDTLACGRTLVCSDLPVLRELYGAAPGVGFFKAGSPDHLVESLVLQFRNCSASAKEAERGREFIETEYSIDEMVRRTIEVYTQSIRA